MTHIIPVTFEQFQAAWNAAFPGKKLLVGSPNRRSHLFMRANDDFWMDNWQEAIARAGRSSYLQAEPWFVADLIIRDRNDHIPKILEGEYDDDRRKPAKQQRDLVRGQDGDFAGI